MLVYSMISGDGLRCAWTMKITKCCWLCFVDDAMFCFHCMFIGGLRSAMTTLFHTFNQNLHRPRCGMCVRIRCLSFSISCRETMQKAFHCTFILCFIRNKAEEEERAFFILLFMISLHQFIWCIAIGEREKCNEININAAIALLVVISGNGFALSN